jgi:hypothetical protein
LANDERENDKYKLSSFGENTLQSAREKGQDETIKNWRDETWNTIYQSNVSRGNAAFQCKIPPELHRQKYRQFLLSR